MADVKVMRGVPGSGKSTWVKQNIHNAVICSADEYFMTPQGEYRFDASKLGAAHNWCLRSFIDELQKPHGRTVVVDNTNVKVFEIAPYYRVAEALGHAVEIIWIHCPPITAFQRGLHGVPLQKVYDMALGFDPLPPWWNVRMVFPS